MTENWLTLQFQVVHPEPQRAMKVKTGDPPGLLGSSIRRIFSSRGGWSADLAFHSSLDFIWSAQTDLANSSWNMLFNLKGEHGYAQAKQGRTVWQGRSSEILYDSRIEIPHFSQGCETLCVSPGGDTAPSSRLGETLGECQCGGGARGKAQLTAALSAVVSF